MPIARNIDLLKYQSFLEIETRQDQQKVFDPIRKRWYVLQPEEFVRQLVILYLNESLNYPLKRIAVERQLTVHQLKKRFDLVVFDHTAKPLILIECKSPKGKIDERVAFQISQYNLSLSANYLWITNGEKNLFYKMDYASNQAKSIERLPSYEIVSDRNEEG